VDLRLIDQWLAEHYEQPSDILGKDGLLAPVDQGGGGAGARGGVAGLSTSALASLRTYRLDRPAPQPYICPMNAASTLPEARRPKYRTGKSPTEFGFRTGDIADPMHPNRQPGNQFPTFEPDRVWRPRLAEY